MNSGRDYKKLKKGNVPVYGTGGYITSVSNKLSDVDAIGLGRKGTINKPYLLKAPFWTVDTLFFLTRKPSNELIFLFPLIQRINWLRYDESTGLPSLSKNNIEKVKIKVPKQDEQKQIGKLISQVNSVILLYQRKLGLLKQLKKSLLQKMFANKNNFSPILRTKGFSNDWQRRKLGDVVNRYDNLRVPITSNKRIPGKTPYYGANGVQDYVNGYTHDGEFILVAEDGASDLSNYPVQYVNGKVWVNNHAHVLQAIKEVGDTRFIGFAIKQSDIASLIVGGSRSKLNADAMMKLNLFLPTIDEEIKISRFFEIINQLFSLYQRKLDTLTNLKKYLLQQMFI